jgi:hypothetical protein
MDVLAGIANLVRRLQQIRWNRGPGCIERVVAELDLVDSLELLVCGQREEYE